MGFFDWLKGKKPAPAEDASGPTAPPSAERVARRALVLSLVMYRASLEQFPGEDQYEELHGRVSEWIDQLGLAAELEKEERELLRRPLGRADERVIGNAIWRNEGVGVLAWALGRYELPPYDEGCDPREAGVGVGFTEELLASMDTSAAQDLLRHAELRPAEEIDRLATHVTIVNWRLRSFQLTPDQVHGGMEIDMTKGTYRMFPGAEGADFPRKEMDFEGYLRAHPSFKPSWLNGLRLVKRDLAIGRDAIADAADEEVATCSSIALERHLAAYWLQGDNAVYSRVDPATILTGMGEGPRVDDDPSQPAATAEQAFNRGKRHAKKGEHDKAIAAYSDAIRLDPQNAGAFSNRGIAFGELGDYERALADFNTALKIEPQNAAFLCNRAFAYLNANDNEHAIADYSAALRLDPNMVRAYGNRGLAYSSTGEYAKAIADFSEAIRLDPQDAQSLLIRAGTYAGKQDHEKAIADYTEVIRLAPETFPTAYGIRGFCYSEMKKYDQALADYTEALRLDPENAETLANHAWLRATCPEARLRDGKKALADAQKACELTAWKEPWHFDTLAAAYAELGRFDQALEWLNKALHSPDYPDGEKEAASMRLKLYENHRPYRVE